MSYIAKFTALACASTLAFIVAGPAAAQGEYPSKAVRLIVTTGAGGQADGLARAFAHSLSQRLNQPVIVDNRVGAAGLIGFGAVRTAAPDGYTLLFAAADLVLLPSTKAAATYDPVKDFTHVALVSRSSMVLAVTQRLPIQNVGELVAYAKAKPGELRIGSYGTGGLLHLIGELFKLKAGVDIGDVPYKSAAEAATAVVAGQIELAVMGISSYAANASRLRAMAQTGPSRARTLTEVPTMREAGMPDVTVENWFAVVAPAELPPAIVNRLNSETAAVLNTEEFVQRAHRWGVEPSPMTPVQFTKFVSDDYKRWAEVVKAAGVPKQ